MKTARLTIRTGALALTILSAGLVAGCGPAADDPGPSGVSAREADALNDAATMLDDNGQDAIIVTNDETPGDKTPENGA